MYFVYTIYNPSKHKIYIGQTKDLDKRMVSHNKREFKGYTSRFEGEWVLIYKESLATRAEAIRRERQLKSFRGREYVKSLIKY